MALLFVKSAKLLSHALANSSLPSIRTWGWAVQTIPCPTYCHARWIADPGPEGLRTQKGSEVQRIRVNRAGTRHKTAWDRSLWSLENDLRVATTRLRDAMKITRKLLGH